MSLWVGVTIIHAGILKFNLNLIWRWCLLDSIVFNLLYAALGLSFWYTCKYISLDKNSLTKIVLSHASAALFASIIWIGFSYIFISNFLAVDENYLGFLQRSLTWRVLIGSLFYFVIIAFYYVYIYSMNFKEQLLKEAELKTLIKDAELKSLKFQINPHFLFNSLNSINSLTISDSQKAGEMTSKLGDYLRYSLSKNEHQKTNLKEELNSAKLYLDIEKVRFGNKIAYIED
ncbi:MAG: sensor histidine kinase, partial [bacterium]